MQGSHTLQGGHTPHLWMLPLNCAMLRRKLQPLPWQDPLHLCRLAAAGCVALSVCTDPASRRGFEATSGYRSQWPCTSAAVKQPAAPTDHAAFTNSTTHLQRDPG